MREGKLERAIREHLAAQPDEAFTTDELCRVCYPGAAQTERKHRVAVLRAIGKALAAEPDWRGRRANLARGNVLVFYNAASVPSTAKGDCKRRSLGWPRLNAPEQWDEPDRLAKAERAVDEHVLMRHGTDEQRHQLAERREAEHQLNTARIQVAAMIARSPMSVLLGQSRMSSRELEELADKARNLMVENDPDAVRDGLREIATKLDALATEAQDPMAAVQAQLAA